MSFRDVLSNVVLGLTVAAGFLGAVQAIPYNETLDPWNLNKNKGECSSVIAKKTVRW
jgi:hypothetical protein